MDLEIARILFTPGELSRYNKWRNTAQQNGIYLFGGNELQELQSVPAIADFIRLLIEASDATHPTDILASLSRLMQFIAQKLQSLPDNNKMLFLLNQIRTGRVCRIGRIERTERIGRGERVGRTGPVERTERVGWTERVG